MEQPATIVLLDSNSTSATPAPNPNPPVATTTTTTPAPGVTSKPSLLGLLNMESSHLLIIFLVVIFAVLILFVLLYYYVIRGMDHRPTNQPKPNPTHHATPASMQSVQTSPQGGPGSHPVSGSSNTATTNTRSQKSITGSANGEKQRNIFAHPEKQMAVDQSVRASPKKHKDTTDTTSDKDDSDRVGGGGMLGLIANVRDTIKDTAK